MNFTDSPFERMMKQKPHVSHKDRYPDVPGGKRKHDGKQSDSRRRGTSGRTTTPQNHGFAGNPGGPKLKP